MWISQVPFGTLAGFAGYAEYGKFENCVAYGNVTSTVDGWEPNVGGFIGQSDNADVIGCHAAGGGNFRLFRI